MSEDKQETTEPNSAQKQTALKGQIRKYLPIVFVVMVMVMQVLPVGISHTNPAVLDEPQWDSPVTRQLAVRACFDCHSNETKWPWYANIAPLSWLVADHVEEGRSHLNFSTFSQWSKRDKHHGQEAAEELKEGEMPLQPYLFLHGEANLDPNEKKALIAGLKATFGTEDAQEEAGGHEDHDHGGHGHE